MILEETLTTLRAGGLVEGRALRDVHLTPYFSVVGLDDGSVGAAMSYYGRPDDLRRLVPAPSPADPLLIGWLFREPGADEDDRSWLLRLSLRTAVLGALSARCIQAGGDGTFSATAELPFDLYAGARRALVVGFGGFMDRFAAAPGIEHLHVCDLGYAARRGQLEREADTFRAAHPGKRITLSSGSDLTERLGESDLVSVTGSALCNGTLEMILEGVKPGQTVIVQGQSASIHPAALFRRGVRAVATTLKPPELAGRAAEDPTGQNLRPFLEGGLRWVYLVPGRGGPTSH